MKLLVEDITDNPYNPRLYYAKDSIRQLAESINEHGLIHKILVRPNNNQFQIATGHRRFKAIKTLGLKHIEVEVKELTDVQMLDIAVIENLQREDLTNIEMAIVIDNYMKQGLTQEQISKKIQKSQTWVSQTWSLIDLPNDIKDDVIRHLIPQSYAVEIIKFQKWFETQLHPRTKGEERQKDCHSMASAGWNKAKHKDKMKSVRAFRDYLETMHWNLLYSRWRFFDYTEWIEYATKNWKELTEQQKQDFWAEYDHHERNFTICHIKHEGLAGDDLIFLGKVEHKWFPYELEPSEHHKIQRNWLDNVSKRLVEMKNEY